MYRGYKNNSDKDIWFLDTDNSKFTWGIINPQQLITSKSPTLLIFETEISLKLKVDLMMGIGYYDNH